MKNKVYVLGMANLKRLSYQTGEATKMVRVAPSSA